MKIFFSGGGSMGSVSPLLAVQNYIQSNYPEHKPEFFWLISQKGPEAKVLAEQNIAYKKIISSRLKRGFNLTILWQLIKLKLAFWQSFIFLIKHRPDVIISAGSYVSPPIIWAAWFLRIPSLIHQQDIRPGLANKMMAPFTKQITVCFPETAKYFNPQKISVVGNPIRPEIIKLVRLSAGEKQEKIKQARQYFQLEDNLPTLLIVSGSQGAVIINQVTIRALPELLEFCQVIHITGRRKTQPAICNLQSNIKNRYHSYEFLTDKYIDALLAADLIVSRAGINFLTEISHLARPSLLIPVYNSHQENNARYFQQKNTAQILSLQDTGGDIVQQTQNFIHHIRTLISNPTQLQELSHNIHQLMPSGAEQKISQCIIDNKKTASS